MLLIKASTCSHLRHNLLKWNKPFFNSDRWISTQNVKDHEVGEVIHGYKLEKVDHIKELNIRPYYLRHIETGAEHLHVRKDGDNNNFFSVALRTTPHNSTGVAHILEHLTLSGSKRYKVREPFMKMLTRSLATFMNAFTGPDFTAYPFSTLNRKDFENLLSVYTDAVFFPRLRPVDFRQEGWRLEHEKPDKKETPIVLKGVVYNEMKGSYSSSDSIYYYQLMNNLFPDTIYRYSSGGDPDHIPKLTLDELKKFHQAYYHPSNAKFFTYGDIPLDRHLELLNSTVMSKFSGNPQAREQSVVREQEPWTQPKKVDITCPRNVLSGSEEKQSTTSISYMLPTLSSNTEDMFALMMLSRLLIEGPSAPFYRTLIETGIGSDYSPSTGLMSYTKQPYFSVGLQGIRHEDISMVHTIIEDTFKEVALTGLPQERVDALLHEIELGFKHISGNFGMRLFMAIESEWNHDGDCVDSLRVQKHTEKFKESLRSDKLYWKNLIERHFITNNHKLFLNMRPDKDFEEKRSDREKALLEDKIAQLNEVDRQTVLYEGMELLKVQSTKDDPNILPCLEPSKDISRDLEHKTSLEFEEHKSVKIQLCSQPTNDVVYFKALSNFGSKLDAAGLIDYLPLFCSVATKLGAGCYDRRVLDQRIQLTTGGLNVSAMINPSCSEFDKFENEVLISSFCLRRNVDFMFDLWVNIFKQIQYSENKKHLEQLIKASATELAEGVSHISQIYAIKKSSSLLSKVASLTERLSGLTHVARMKDMVANEQPDQIVPKLEMISKIILDPFDMKCSINAESDAIRSTSDSLKKFIETAQKNHTKMGGGGLTGELPVSVSETTKVDDLKFSFATHSVAKSLVAVPMLHDDFPKLLIMCKLLSSKYLRNEIREKGGAYGSGAQLSSSGLLSFFSYRDPNTVNTMKVFDYSHHWLTNGSNFDDRDIEECKLGVFQKVDEPVYPGQRGSRYFFHGISDDMYEEHRRRLLDVTKNDVINVAKKYLNQEKYGSFII